MTCAFIKPDGSRCGAKPLQGKTLCFFHDPSSAVQRDAARRKGGLTRVSPNSIKLAVTLPADTPVMATATVADVIALLGKVINDTLTGHVSVNVGNCVGQLAGVLLRALEGGEFEKKLQELEASKAARRVRRSGA